jgi:hypothetical protein
VFKFDVPERTPRTEFLTKTLQLGTKAGRASKGLPDDLHWMFFGFPFLWLGHVQVNGVPLLAHLTRHIGGERLGATADFQSYKVGEKSDPISWDNVPADERAELALQLVDMVRTLETIGLVHGDLSHGNVLIGPGLDGRRIATLCDYDGYYYPKVPLLPRMQNGQPIRPVGTIEYQHPDLNERFNSDPNATDGGLYVATDRFAMGVLICEMMSWSSDLKTALVRETLLSQDDIRSRSLQAIDQKAPQARQMFPGGFELLERALQTRGMWSGSDSVAWSKNNLPGPDEWEEKIVGGGGAVWPKGAHPTVSILNASRRPAVLWKEGPIVNARGHFNVGSSGPPLLEQIHFEWREADGRLDLQFHCADDVRRRKGGVGAMLKEPSKRPLTVHVRPGDHFAVGGWLLQFR